MDVDADVDRNRVGDEGGLAPAASGYRNFTPLVGLGEIVEANVEDNAPPEEREKYEISQDRRMIIWDPDKCSINDEVRTKLFPNLYQAHLDRIRVPTFPEFFPNQRNVGNHAMLFRCIQNQCLELLLYFSHR